MLPKSNLFRAFCVFCLCLSMTVFALADTIRLKDGSIIKGKIVSFGGGKFVVMIGDGTRRREMSFNAEDIEKIVFDNQTIPTTVASNTNDQNYQKTPPTVTKNGDNTVITVGSNTQKTEPPVTSKNDDEEVTDDITDTTNTTATTTTRTENIKPIEISVKVLADNTSNGWSNTGFVVKKGQKIKITANGRVSLGNGRYASPTGINSLPDNEKLLKTEPTGGLIAVIGDDNNDFIYIGQTREFTATRDGALFLGVNEGNLNDNTGSFDVKVEIDPTL